MVDPLTVILGLDPGTLTGSQSSSHIAGIGPPFGYKASTDTVISQ